MFTLFSAYSFGAFFHSYNNKVGGGGWEGEASYWPSIMQNSCWLAVRHDLIIMYPHMVGKSAKILPPHFIPSSTSWPVCCKHLKLYKGEVQLIVSITLPIHQAIANSMSFSKAEKEMDLLQDGSKN